MSAPQRFRKRPVEIEAMYFTPGAGPGVGYTIAKWCGGRFNTDVKPSDRTDVRYSISIPTLEGVMTADEGDYNEQGAGGPLTQVVGYAVRGPKVAGQYIRESLVQRFLPITINGTSRNQEEYPKGVSLFLMEVNRDRIVSIVYEAKL